MPLRPVATDANPGSTPDVEVSSSPGVDGALAPEIERLVRWLLHREERDDVVISVALVDDREIERINREYLSHEGPTDVISFPLQTPDDRMIGDIYIGLEQASRQAAEINTTLAEEVARLAIHGTLHVLGWEHPEDGDRSESPMYRRQEELLALWKGDPRK